VNLSWLPYVLTMLQSAEVRAFLRRVFDETGGNVGASKLLISRMTDKSAELFAAEAEIDVQLDELDQRRGGGKPS
jgi:hypothetical protein